MRMRYSAAGYDRTKQFEGLRLSSYSKSGDVWTIGYGHTKNVRPGQTISISQAENFLSEDVTDAENLVYNFVTVELNQNQFDGLVDGAFNLGTEFFRNADGSKTKILTFVNSEKFQLAAEEFLKWDHFRGRVLSQLLMRRTWEANLFAEGAD